MIRLYRSLATSLLAILALTAWRVVRPVGVNADEQVTMPEFWGTAGEPGASAGRRQPGG